MPIQLASVFLLICYKQVRLLFSVYIYPSFFIARTRLRKIYPSSTNSVNFNLVKLEKKLLNFHTACFGVDLNEITVVKEKRVYVYNIKNYATENVVIVSVKFSNKIKNNRSNNFYF